MGLNKGYAILTAFTVGAGLTAADAVFNDGAYRQRLSEMVAPRGIATKNQPAPDFSLPSLDLYKLSDHKGMPVVVNFWEWWCPDCKDEEASLEQFAQEYKGLVTILKIATDENGLREYMRENASSSLVLLDSRKNASFQYGVPGTPTTYIVDSKGILVRIQIGATDFMDTEEGSIKNTIDSLLNKR